MTFVVGALFGWAVVKVSDWARGRWGWGWLYVQAVERGRRLAESELRPQLEACRADLVAIKAELDRWTPKQPGRAGSPVDCAVPAVTP